MYFPKLSELPDVLRCNDGSFVTTAEEWEAKRRKEVYDCLADSVYGRVPDLPIEVTHTKERTETAEGAEYDITVTATTKFGSASFKAYISVPKASAPCPVVELIQFPYQETALFKEKLFANGYALARFYYPEICADDNNDFSGGIHAVIREPDGVRKPNTWGAVASWAWAASRVMDIVETIPGIDSSRAAIVGHSRTGKAALWCAASDRRFKMVCSNETGCSGAAITRGKQGEHLKGLCENFPCWLCDACADIADDEDALAFDQHWLLGLAAPAALYVTSAAGDLWSGPEGEFLGAKYAAEVYALYGKKGIELEAFPEPGTVDQSGDIGYHLRTGEHALNAFDWDQIIRFADKTVR